MNLECDIDPWGFPKLKRFCISASMGRVSLFFIIIGAVLTARLGVVKLLRFEQSECGGFRLKSREKPRLP